ncbi:MAG TPA: flagellar biosynthesis protein FlhF [Steroidobacteraceae bacterium]|nr:flagellar biosynthesis protein FlhF [Steroidobacteraceae bacterium]
MKITRHTAPDMRQALKAVREQLGADAVILASRRTPQGVEVTAAMDFDAETLATEADAVVPAQAPAPLTATPPPTALPRRPALGAARAQTEPPSLGLAPAARECAFDAPESELVAPALMSAITEAALGPPAALSPTVPLAPSVPLAPILPLVPAALAPPSTAEPAACSRPGAPETAPAVIAMENELKTLRRMLETQLAQLAWKDLARRAPIHAEMLRELTEVGIAPDLATEVVAQIPPNVELAQARRLGIASIAQRLLVTGDQWLQQGGTIALVGATGVGKTTTLAKLAVRWVLQHGPRDLALIAADAVRMGAQDQVHSLGQLLGAQVYTLEDFTELPSLLTRLGRRRLVLIDSPGSSQRDSQLGMRLTTLAAAGRELQTTLVLAASTQAGAVAEAVRRFAPAKPTSCVLTKVDEAASLGGTLSVLMRARLPISYVSEGQRVPEDLRPARTLELVSSAVQLAQASGAAADEDLLKRRFGEVAHAIA